MGWRRGDAMERKSCPPSPTIRVYFSSKRECLPIYSRVPSSEPLSGQTDPSQIVVIIV